MDEWIRKSLSKMDGKWPTTKKIREDRWVYHIGIARENQTKTASGVGNRGAIDEWWHGLGLNQKNHLHSLLSFLIIFLKNNLR